MNTIQYNLYNFLEIYQIEAKFFILPGYRQLRRPNLHHRTVERRNRKLGWDQNLLILGLFRHFPTIMAGFFPTIKQQIQQDSHCQVWMLFGVSHFPHGLSDHHLLCAHFSHL